MAKTLCSPECLGFITINRKNFFDSKSQLSMLKIFIIRVKKLSIRNILRNQDFIKLKEFFFFWKSSFTRIYSLEIFLLLCLLIPIFCSQEFLDSITFFIEIFYFLIFSSFEFKKIFFFTYRLSVVSKSP